ncbi:MAG: DnaK suppressor protein, partial [Patiriisocius sp.]
KPTASENAIVRISRIDALNNKTVKEHLLIKSELKSLKMALTKFDNIDFGKCIKCDQSIPLGSIL